MIKLLERLGQSSIQSIITLGEIFLFFLKILRVLPIAFKKPSLIIYQIYKLGMLSLPIILVSGLFVGFVLCLQGYVNLIKFGAAASVGTIVALSLLRELGPVLTGLLYTGRAGSSLAAEIGLMQATEQWTSYEMMAVDPFRHIVAPRFIAGTLAMPLLAGIFSMVGILGGAFVATFQLNVDLGAYWSQMQASVDLKTDIINGVLYKSTCFAIISTLLALYHGWKSFPTAEGISHATTKTVVQGSLSILCIDFLLTAILFAQ